MLLVALWLVTTLLPASSIPAQGGQTPELPVLKAGLGPCSADFIVKDAADGAPVYLALIHARVRYGFMSIKRMDVEVGTNSDGKARIEGLPDKARPIAYDVRKDTKTAAAEQDVASRCEASFELVLE